MTTKPYKIAKVIANYRIGKEDREIHFPTIVNASSLHNAVYIKDPSFDILYTTMHYGMPDEIKLALVKDLDRESVKSLVSVLKERGTSLYNLIGNYVAPRVVVSDPFLVRDARVTDDFIGNRRAVVQGYVVTRGDVKIHTLDHRVESYQALTDTLRDGRKLHMIMLTSTDPYFVNALELELMQKKFKVRVFLDTGMVDVTTDWHYEPVDREKILQVIREINKEIDLDTKMYKLRELVRRDMMEGFH